MRAIRPKDEKESQSPSDPHLIPEVSKRRKCISSACLPCRRRKSKCDGGTPFCSTCTAVYHTQCAYDIDSDHRRKAALKKDIQALKEQNGALGVIIAAIKTGSDSEVSDVIQQLRADEDLDGIAESLKRDAVLAEPLEGATVEGEASTLIGGSSTDARGNLTHFGHTSNLGLVNQHETAQLESSVTEEWTSVTDDPSLVRHLLELFFCWAHPFHTLFSKPAFLQDMAAGRNKYCSPVLVNAVLALGCHYTDRPEVRTDPADPTTAGENFFQEAKRLLYQDETSCLTTVQALAIMGLREPSCGRDSSGFSYIGRSVCMALELGLHVKFDNDGHRLGPTELEVRRITFWGLFNFETCWSICIGRPTHFPLAAINMDRPTVLEQLDKKSWMLYNDCGIDINFGMEQPSQSHTMQDQFISLSEIINDTVVAFYAPQDRFTSRKLLGFYKRYTKWYGDLPPSLHLQDVTLPQVLVLHMYYHCCLIHLFRAFLKVELVRSNVSPRAVCTQSSNSINSLLSIYRRTYGFRRSCILVCHVALTANIIDLINLPNATSARNLELGVTVMREGETNHRFFLRDLHILLELSKQWGIELPAEVNQAAYAMREPPYSNTQHFGVEPHPWTTTAPSLSVNFPSTHPQSHEEYRPSTTTEVPYYVSATYTSSSPPKHSFQPPASDLFWSPFPGHSLPLQAASQPNPMEIMQMVESDGGRSWDQLGRDGFRMADNGDGMFSHTTQPGPAGSSTQSEQSMGRGHGM